MGNGKKMLPHTLTFIQNINFWKIFWCKKIIAEKRLHFKYKKLDALSVIKNYLAAESFTKIRQGIVSDKLKYAFQ